MSEELKEKARHFLIEKCGYAPCKNDAPGGSFDKIVTSCTEFASQVCEQRDADRDDELVAAALGDSLTDLAEQGQDLDLAEHWQKRAEAAELALQKSDDKASALLIANLSLADERDVWRENCTIQNDAMCYEQGLKRKAEDALQAKEQELAQLKERCAKEKAEVLLARAAQARQQAIADPGIREIAALSLERALLWHKAGLDSWSESDWFTAFAGEVGELGNVIKKLNRYRDGLPGNSRSEAELRSDAAKEIADCYLYMDLLAQRMSIDLLPAIIAKFNEVSERNNFPQRIRSLTPPPALTVAKEAK